MRAAAERTFCTAGSSRPISTAMMARTTSSSISVKARRRRTMASLRGRSPLFVVLACGEPQQLGGLGTEAGELRTLQLLALHPRDGLVVPRSGLFFRSELPVGLGEKELGLGWPHHGKPERILERLDGGLPVAQGVMG